MIKQMTKSFIVYLNDRLEILFAQCRKTGKFVQKALARLELEYKVNYDEVGCIIALTMCILSIVNAVAYASNYFTMSELAISNVIALTALAYGTAFAYINHKLTIA